MKRSEVSIKTRSTPASLSFKGQATKHTTVKWSIVKTLISKGRVKTASRKKTVEVVQRTTNKFINLTKVTS